MITSIAEDDIRAIVRSPTALVGSDGNCVADYGVTSQGMPHPRFYGTFPRILGHYVHDEHLLPLEAAVHKMTGATAAALRLERSRTGAQEGFAPTSRSSTRPISASAQPTPSRTNTRAARARPCSSTAPSSSVTHATPARSPAPSCAAPPTAASGNLRKPDCGSRLPPIVWAPRSAPTPRFLHRPLRTLSAPARVTRTKSTRRDCAGVRADVSIRQIGPTKIRLGF